MAQTADRRQTNKKRLLPDEAACSQLHHQSHFWPKALPQTPASNLNSHSMSLIWFVCEWYMNDKDAYKRPSSLQISCAQHRCHIWPFELHSPTQGWSGRKLRSPQNDWSWNTTDLDGPRSLLTAMNCEIHLSHLTSPMRNLLQGMLKIIWQSLQSWQEIVKAHFPPTKPASTKDVKHVTVWESQSVFWFWAKHLVCGSSFRHLAKRHRRSAQAEHGASLGTACTRKI